MLNKTSEQEFALEILKLHTNILKTKQTGNNVGLEKQYKRIEINPRTHRT